MDIETVSVVEIGRRLLVTVPPNPQDEEIERLQEGILQAMHGRRLLGVVLDIGAVQVVDSFFARVLVETSQMVRLMGGETVVAGLQPAVALTLTELGLTLDEIEKAVDVEEALAMLSES